VSPIDKAVLDLLLERHPALLSEEEVVRALAPEPATFADRDAVRLALRELAQAGLAHRLGRFVFATSAAVRFRDVEKDA
jgi:hypothetical protein